MSSRYPMTLKGVECQVSKLVNSDACPRRATGCSTRRPRPSASPSTTLDSSPASLGVRSPELHALEPASTTGDGSVDSCSVAVAAASSSGPPSGTAASCWSTVRARRGLSSLSVFHSKSVLYGAFVWVRRALSSPKRRFPARAVAYADVALLLGLQVMAPLAPPHTLHTVY